MQKDNLIKKIKWRLIQWLLGMQLFLLTILEIINDLEALVRQVEQQFATASIAEKHSLEVLVRQVEQHFANASIADKHSLLHECEVMLRDRVIIKENFRDKNQSPIC